MVSRATPHFYAKAIAGGTGAAEAARCTLRDIADAAGQAETGRHIMAAGSLRANGTSIAFEEFDISGSQYDGHLKWPAAPHHVARRSFSSQALVASLLCTLDVMVFECAY